MQNLYYSTISECPLINWENRFKEGNSAIRKNSTTTDELLAEAKKRFVDDIHIAKGEGKPLTDEQLLTLLDYDAWDILYQDFERNVKEDELFEKYKRDLDRYVRLMIRYRKSERVQDGVKIHDTRITNEIALMEAMVLKYEKNLGQSITINKMLTKLRRLEGRHINKKDLTVLDYFDLIEEHSGK